MGSKCKHSEKMPQERPFTLPEEEEEEISLLKSSFHFVMFACFVFLAHGLSTYK